MFPRNPDVCSRWKAICKINVETSTKSKFVCEEHFHQKDFVNESKHMLNPNVVPKEMNDEEMEACDTNTIINNNVCGSISSSLSTVTNSNDHNYSTVPFEILSTPHNKSSVNENGSEVINVASALNEHDYCVVSENTVNDDSNCALHSSDSSLNSLNVRQLSQGTKRKCGFLTESGASSVLLSDREKVMYRIHRRATSTICKLQKNLSNAKDKIKELNKLYDNHIFTNVHNNLNYVTTQFIDSQLRNVGRASSGKRWPEQDKTFALSIYKRGPRLYKYLSVYFQLPSIRTLKQLLSQIPFRPGVNELLLKQLQLKVNDMHELDKNCCLIFDEISLSSGLHYDPYKQIIVGFEDLGELGRTNRQANHGLVFMIRGLRRTWKQVVSYYFTAHTISPSNLKCIIKNIICKLQCIGLIVRATICDQGSTQRKALTELCAENNNPAPYIFYVNKIPIVTVYDVPHLLKCTRNSMLRCNIKFATDKTAKFKYIQNLFNIDQRKKYKMLYKLRPEHFKFSDTFMKMKVKIAAAQLSHTVAAGIESCCVSNINQEMPSEALQTAEFVQTIDDLFDSLNGSTLHADEGKVYRCVLKEDSQHLELWAKLLQDISKWQLFEIETQKNVTNQYYFIKSWTITIRSVIYLWQTLRSIGFNYLNLRCLNQDPVENLFCLIRQHGVFNTNPTCHQFTAALKTVVINNLALPKLESANCESDNCENLDNFRNFLNISKDNSTEPSLSNEDESFTSSPQLVAFDDLNVEDCLASTYVAGYLVKKITVPDKNCSTCSADLFSEVVEHHHLFTSFKENSEKTSLVYASKQVVTLVENLHNVVYFYLDEHGHEDLLEQKIKNFFYKTYKSAFCSMHNCDTLLINVGVRLLIFKYVKDKKKPKERSTGFYNKIKQFKA